MTMFYNTMPDDQDQERFFWSLTGLVLRPMVSDHITVRVRLRVFIQFRVWGLGLRLDCGLGIGFVVKDLTVYCYGVGLVAG